MDSGFSFMYIILHDEELYLQWQQLIVVRNKTRVKGPLLMYLKEYWNVFYRMYLFSSKLSVNSLSGAICRSYDHYSLKG
jgi:hypothetical protein